jgi:hypothetical protein
MNSSEDARKGLLSNLETVATSSGYGTLRTPAPMGRHQRVLSPLAARMASPSAGRTPRSQLVDRRYKTLPAPRSASGLNLERRSHVDRPLMPPSRASLHSITGLSVATDHEPDDLHNLTSPIRGVRVAPAAANVDPGLVARANTLFGTMQMLYRGEAPALAVEAGFSADDSVLDLSVGGSALPVAAMADMAVTMPTPIAATPLVSAEVLREQTLHELVAQMAFYVAGKPERVKLLALLVATGLDLNKLLSKVDEAASAGSAPNMEGLMRDEWAQQAEDDLLQCLSLMAQGYDETFSAVRDGAIDAAGILAANNEASNSLIAVHDKEQIVNRYALELRNQKARLSEAQATLMANPDDGAAKAAARDSESQIGKIRDELALEAIPILLEGYKRHAAAIGRQFGCLINDLSAGKRALYDHWGKYIETLAKLYQLKFACGSTLTISADFFFQKLTARAQQIREGLEEVEAAARATTDFTAWIIKLKTLQQVAANTASSIVDKRAELIEACGTHQYELSHEDTDGLEAHGPTLTQAVVTYNRIHVPYNVTDTSGDTLLHAAVAAGNFEAMQMLLGHLPEHVMIPEGLPEPEWHSLLQVRNMKGQTPLDLAIQIWHESSATQMEAAKRTVMYLYPLMLQSTISETELKDLLVSMLKTPRSDLSQLFQAMFAELVTKQARRLTGVMKAVIDELKEDEAWPQLAIVVPHYYAYLIKQGLPVSASGPLAVGSTLGAGLVADWQAEAIANLWQVIASQQQVNQTLLDELLHIGVDVTDFTDSFSTTLSQNICEALTEAKTDPSTYRDRLETMSQSLMHLATGNAQNQMVLKAVFLAVINQHDHHVFSDLVRVLNEVILHELHIIRREDVSASDYHEKSRAIYQFAANALYLAYEARIEYTGNVTRDLSEERVNAEYMQAYDLHTEMLQALYETLGHEERIQVIAKLLAKIIKPADPASLVSPPTFGSPAGHMHSAISSRSLTEDEHDKPDIIAWILELSARTELYSHASSAAGAADGVTQEPLADFKKIMNILIGSHQSSALDMIGVFTRLTEIAWVYASSADIDISPVISVLLEYALRDYLALAIEINPIVSPESERAAGVFFGSPRPLLSRSHSHSSDSPISVGGEASARLPKQSLLTMLNFIVAKVIDDCQRTRSRWNCCSDRAAPLRKADITDVRSLLTTMQTICQAETYRGRVPGPTDLSSLLAKRFGMTSVSELNRQLSSWIIKLPPQPVITQPQSKWCGLCWGSKAIESVAGTPMAGHGGTTPLVKPE